MKNEGVVGSRTPCKLQDSKVRYLHVVISEREQWGEEIAGKKSVPSLL